MRKTTGEQGAPSMKTGEQGVPSMKTGEQGVPSMKTGEQGVPSMKTGEQGVPLVAIHTTQCELVYFVRDIIFVFVWLFNTLIIIIIIHS